MTSWICLVFWLIFTSALADRNQKERNFRFVINKFEMKSTMKGLFEDYNSIVTQIHNRSYINCHFMLKRNLDQLDVDMQLDLQKANNQIIRLYKMRMNACDFSTTLHKNPLLNLVAKKVMNVSTIRLKCPLLSHVNYTFINWHLVETDFPSYIPECQIKSVTKFYTHNNLSATTTFLASVVYNK